MFMTDKKFGKIFGWEQSGDCWTSTDSPGFVRRPRSRGYLAIRRLVLSGWSGGKKNRVRVLRYGAPELLRQQDTAHPGSDLRGCAGLSGSGRTPCLLPEVWEGEAGTFGLAGRQSLLREAFCPVCGAALPGHEHPGCGQGSASGLAYGEGVGEAVHGSPTTTCRHARSEGHWNRRTCG